MKNKILQRLASFDERAIARLTREAIFERGFDYWLKGNVKKFFWAEDGSLNASVQGVSRYQVTISLHAYKTRF